MNSILDSQFDRDKTEDEMYDNKRYQALVKLGEKRGLTKNEWQEIKQGIGLTTPRRDKSGLAWTKQDDRYYPNWPR